MWKPRIYLAGPLFTSAEREWNVQLCKLLMGYGFDVWLPQLHEPREKTAKAIFEMDVKGLEWAEAVVAIMDGPDPDSGTCWEVGWAYAMGKPILGVRTDFRGSGEGNLCPYNLMLSESCTKRIEAHFVKVERVAELICYQFDHWKAA